MNWFPDSRWRQALAAMAVLWLSACQSHPPLPTAPAVDIDRFMGDWYVIANIPTLIERNGYAATESYRRAPDGRILTTFRLRRDSLNGPWKVYHPVGFVKPGSHGAIWGMRFVWPILADYRVLYVDPDYQLTVIGRQKRDYAWIMARTPSIPQADVERMTALLRDVGYDTAALRPVPQPPAPR